MRSVFSIIIILFASNVFAAPKSVEEGVFVRDAARRFLPSIRAQRLLTIDHPNRFGYEVYGPRGLRDWLTQRKVPFESAETEILLGKRGRGAEYPSFAVVEAKLKEIAAKYPKNARLFSIGKSVKGRDLWVMKISANPDQDLPLPEVKYISSMHGDEITGREVMIRFTEELLSSYAKSEAVKALIDNTELFIMPSMNPDGSESHQRGNGRNVDLNRSFPDFTTSDNQNDPKGREPEVQAIMGFQSARKFVLSANFHGGAEVVNYMWDTDRKLHPFDALLKEVALGYAGKVSYLRNSRSFPNGITNGFNWYEVDGGMQDWSYYWYGDLQFTIEISGDKWPDYGQMPKFYQENRDALLSFFINAHQGAGFTFRERGVKGRVEVFQTTGRGEQRLGEYAFDESEYYQVLQKGSYRFLVKPVGRAPVEVKMEVKDGIRAGGNYARL